METKELIDAIREALAERGLAMPMCKGRDAIARLIFGRPFSPVIAALRAGTLGRPEINDIGIADIRMRYGDTQAKLAVEVASAILLKTT